MLNRIDRLRVVLAAVEARSFREAAVRLAVSPQVVSRAVGELEAHLGDALFHRSTRSVQVTDFGRDFAHRAREAVAGIDGLFGNSRSPAANELRGTLRIAAPVAIGQRFVGPVLQALMAEHAGLTFDLRLSEAVVDAVDDRIDLGVRVGSPRDSRFVARSVATVPWLVCAAPGLIERVGSVATIEVLHTLPTTLLIDRNTGRPWPWSFSRDRQMVPRAPAFTTDDPQAECDAVLSGAGFGQLAGYLALPHLRSGALEAVLQGVAPKPLTLSVYRSRRDPVPARLRLAFDALIQGFRDPSWFPAP